MKAVQIIAMRIMSLCLVIGIVAGSFGMAGHAHADVRDAHHVTHHTAQEPTVTQHNPACPHDLTETSGTAGGHEACAMAVCCFADIQSPVPTHVATVEPAQFGLRGQRVPPDTEPERADKPPRLT